MRVLVTGAAGFVGERLVPALLDAGHEVVALVRDRGRYDPPAGVTVAEGDLLDPGSFETALEGCEAAYYLVHSMGGGRDYAERDRRAAHNFARAAEDAALDRVVYLGGLGSDADRLSEHLRSRREVEYVLSESTVDLTALRAAVIVGSGSASFRIVHQISRLPVMVTPRWVRTPVQPVAIDDVVRYLVGVLGLESTRGEVYEVGGPEVMSYGEMIARTARISRGRAPIVLPVPVLSPRLSAYWLGLVTDVPMSVAHPLVLGLRNPVVVEDHRIEELLPFERTSFERAVLRALSPTESEPVSPEVPKVS